MDDLAGRLFKARTSRDMTQTQLAKAAGVSQGTVGNIEAGIRGGLNSLAPIAIALQIRYLWLRDGDGDMELPRTAWPFSAELGARVTSLEGDELRRAENQLRAYFDLDLIQAPRAPLGIAHSEQDPAGGTILSKDDEVAASRKRTPKRERDQH